MKGLKNLSFNYLKELNVNAMPRKEAPYNGPIILEEPFFNGQYKKEVLFQLKMVYKKLRVKGV